MDTQESVQEKPVSPEKLPGEDLQPDRRKFITKSAGLAWSAAAAALASVFYKVIPAIPNEFFQDHSLIFNAGRIEDYSLGCVDSRFRETKRVWIIRSLDSLYVLSAVCPHCSELLEWRADEAKMSCRDGCGFYKTGIPFEGPRIEALPRFKISLNETGEILVDPNKRYLQKEGGWDHPESFLVLSRLKITS